MSLSPAGYPADLDPSNPKGTDPGSILDDQDRNILQSIKQTFPNVSGAVNATQAQLNSAMALGYGGIALSAPTDIADIVVGITPVLVSGYDVGSYAVPLDVTQSFSTGILTVEAGTWEIYASLSARATLTTDPDRRLTVFVNASPGGNLRYRANLTVPYSPSGGSGGGGGAISGVLTTASSTDLKLMFFAGAGNVTVTYLDALEFFVRRVTL